jgi:integrase/recombinase XerD
MTTTTMTTTTLRERLADYIQVRRGLGFKLEAYPWMLGDFVSYLEEAGASTVTTELAVAWACQPGVGAHPSYLSKRLSVVRGFARHLSAFDPATEVPPLELLPDQACRATPYLYSKADIVALIGAARALNPRLRAATYETLIGLLVVSGARIGELIRLDRGDIDWDEGTLAITYTKFNKHRELALHPSTVKALRSYADERDEAWPEPKDSSFFVSTLGTRLVHVTVQQAFARLARDAGLRPRSAQCRPRIHDFRHSFACSTLIGWYRAGLDVEAQMPLLSTWMGHANPANSFWYLSAVPELVSLAAERRQRAVRRGS